MVGEHSWDLTNNYHGSPPLVTADAMPAALHYNSAPNPSYVSSPLSTNSTETGLAPPRSKPRVQATPNGADRKQRKQRPGQKRRQTVTLPTTCTFNGCKNTQTFTRQCDFKYVLT